MEKTYLSITIEPEVLIGQLMKAISKGEKYQMSIGENDSTNEQAPQFANRRLGVSVWQKKSQYDEQGNKINREPQQTYNNGNNNTSQQPQY